MPTWKFNYCKREYSFKRKCAYDALLAFSKQALWVDPSDAKIIKVFEELERRGRRTEFEDGYSDYTDVSDLIHEIQKDQSNPFLKRWSRDPFDFDSNPGDVFGHYHEQWLRELADASFAGKLLTTSVISYLDGSDKNLLFDKLTNKFKNKNAISSPEELTSELIREFLLGEMLGPLKIILSEIEIFSENEAEILANAIASRNDVEHSVVVQYGLLRVRKDGVQKEYYGLGSLAKETESMLAAFDIVESKRLARDGWDSSPFGLPKSHKLESLDFYSEARNRISSPKWDLKDL